MTRAVKTFLRAVIDANARRSLERDVGLRPTVAGDARPGLQIVRRLLDWIGGWGSRNIWLQMHRLDQLDMGDDD